ncbi:hypothetical protein [Streptomyces botrytidirepellens]|nr:hypothetical protein [Streptomyces botrytidirepellens]
MAADEGGFRPEDQNDLAPAVPMARLEANLAAPRVLRQIQGEEREATSSRIKTGEHDAAIGHVPFHSVRLTDPRPNDVRVGGVAAFIATLGTSDKTSKAARSEMAELADLMRVIRLRNGGYVAAACTNVAVDAWPGLTDGWGNSSDPFVARSAAVLDGPRLAFVPLLRFDPSLLVLAHPIVCAPGGGKHV